MSSVEAAKLYGVPQSTIRNHNRQRSMAIGSRRPSLLGNMEEKYLVQLLLDLEQMSVRLTKDKVLKVAEEFVGSLKQNGRKFIS